MVDLRTIVLWVEVALVATQLIMLALQLNAFWRHRHYSFLLLAIGTLLALAYMLFLWMPRLVPSLRANFETLYFIALVFAAIQMPLATWGTAALFRSYRRLAEKGQP